MANYQSWIMSRAERFKLPVEEVANRAEEIAKEMGIRAGDPAAEPVIGARLDDWFAAVALKEDEMAALVESAEVILRGMTDGLRAIDAGKTAEARQEIGRAASQIADLKTTLQKYQLRRPKGEPKGPR